MKRKAKRLLSMLMVVVMLLGMLPTGSAFARDGEYNDPETAFNDTAVRATKTVSGPNDDGSYTITLGVKGDTTTSTEMQNVPADIVLVVDTSTSMKDRVSGQTTRLDVAKAAAKNFVDQLMTDGSDVKIGVIFLVQIVLMKGLLV